MQLSWFLLFFSVSCQNDFTGLGWVTVRLDQSECGQILFCLMCRVCMYICLSIYTYIDRYIERYIDIYIFSQCPQMTVFKSQTRTDLHNLIMWLFGHLISLKVCRVLLSSLPLSELGRAPSLPDSRCFAQQIVQVRRTLSCVSVNVRVGHTGQALSCSRVAPCWALLGVWLGANLTVQTAAGSRFRTMEWRFSTFLKKNHRLLIYTALC